MTTALELVYEYRHLIGKCQAGAGLSIDEIQAVDTIEAVFSVPEAVALGDQTAGLTATLRGGPRKLCDRVDLVAFRLDGLEVRGLLYVDPGARVELLIEDEELRLSYRFKGEVLWTRDEESGTLIAGIKLVGTPVLVRRGPAPRKADPRSAAPRLPTTQVAAA